ncbi:MAG: hypothetical protein KGJ31_03005, partial [Patescibacteria group bacterium]|nr:hypothetical protein [Patescibacteria group bacterium]
APGVMTAGFISAAIAQEIPGVLVCRIEMAFKTPLYAGSRPSVLCIVSSQKGRLAKVTVSVMDGSDIVAKGSCLLLLPEA